jgi:hypothetical protein
VSPSLIACGGACSGPRPAGLIGAARSPGPMPAALGRKRRPLPPGKELKGMGRPPPATFSVYRKHILPVLSFPGVESIRACVPDESAPTQWPVLIRPPGSQDCSRLRSPGQTAVYSLVFSGGLRSRRSHPCQSHYRQQHQRHRSLTSKAPRNRSRRRFGLQSYDRSGNLFGCQCGKQPSFPTTSDRSKRRG